MPLSPLTAWLRPLLSFLGLAGLLTLSACGGGGGAPNNMFAPTAQSASPLVVLPTSATIYPGTPATLTISGGTPPYRVFSSNAAVLPLAQNVAGNTVLLLANAVSTDTATTVTVQDSGGQTTPATILVRPAALFPSALTVIASSAECGSGNLCTGATGTVGVQVNGPAGSPGAGRQVRFDVVYGPFSILTSNPAAPLATTLTVTTDGTGRAQVGIQSAVDATTAPAQIRVTDLTSGQQQIANFTVVRTTTTTSITVVPPTATIQGAFVNECSSGFRIDYFIYGGSPPYRISSTFPNSVTLSTMTVNQNGGFFSATTNGSCVNPLTFTIFDAAGRQTTALLENLPGTVARPAPPPPSLSVSFTQASGACVNKTYSAFVSGGTPPYNITGTAPAMIDNQALPGPGVVNISGLTDGGIVYTIGVSDSSTPAMATSFTITCPR